MNQPAPLNNSGFVGRLSQDQLTVLTDQICPKASPVELELFLTVCQRTGLDPFSRQIYGLRRRQKDGDQWVEKMTIQISVDGYRTIAERSGKYEGQTMPQFCGPDGRWRETWFEQSPPAAARVGVYKKGHREPTWGVAYWTEYVQTTRDGSLTSMWARMPTTMLSKCAEVQALRKAFPHETQMVGADREADLVVAGPAPLALEDGTYQGTPAHKRALQAAVRSLGLSELDNPTALRELHAMVMGCPIDELEAKIQEAVGSVRPETAAEGWET